MSLVQVIDQVETLEKVGYFDSELEKRFYLEDLLYAHNFIEL
jgi:hypothetical protein